MAKVPGKKRKKREITPEHRAKLLQSLEKARATRIEKSKKIREWKHVSTHGADNEAKEVDIPGKIDELVAQRLASKDVGDTFLASLYKEKQKNTDNNDSGFTTMEGALERLRAVTGEIRASRRALPPGSRKQLDKLIGEC